MVAAIGVAILAAAMAALSHLGVLKGGAPGTGDNAAGRPAAAPVAPAAPAPDASAVTVGALVVKGVHVRVERDGVLLYDGVLAVGPQQWQGAEEVTVWVADASAVRFTVNNREIGMLGEQREPASRTFTAEDGAAE